MKPKRILVPTDFVDGDRGVLEAAASLASPSGGEVLLMHVVGDPAEEVYGEKSMEGKDRAAWALWKVAKEGIEERLKELAAESVPRLERCRVLCAFGDPSTRIIETAASEEVDLVVISGRRRKSLLQGTLLGSVAYKVVRGAPCDVLVVR